MSRIVYVDGAYVPEEEAKVSVFDRGFLFADGVYEVTSVLGGKLIDFDGHAARLERSLTELDMAAPVTMEELLEIRISCFRTPKRCPRRWCSLPSRSRGLPTARRPRKASR